MSNDGHLTMSVTGSVRGFSEFDDIATGRRPGYSHNLTKLFNVDSDNKDIRHPITFREASERLIKKCDDTLLELQIQDKEVEEFVIGKSFVKQRPGVTFRPDRPTTWSLGGGVNGRWREYLDRDYYGLVVLGCVEKELIPTASKHIKFSYDEETFSVDQQLYALALEQSLIHHYMFEKPDKRLRNHSLDCGRKSTVLYKGFVIYVAFKVKFDEEDTNLEQNVSAFLIYFNWGLNWTVARNSPYWSMTFDIGSR